MWRLGIVALGFSTALGLGLAGGMNLHRLVDPDQATTWLQQTGSTLQSGFEAARHGIGSKIASFASSPTSVSETTERVARQEPNSGEAVARMVGDLNRQMDQVRTANEGTARDLSQGIERLRGSTEEHQRELVAKLAQLAERVERVERQPAVAATPVKTQPVVQPTPSSPPSKLTAKPAPKPALKSASQAKAKATAKPPTVANRGVPRMDETGIANWSVRSVFEDTAVLEGPRGRIAVGPGDTIPGIGQIQAIMRSGGRWVVATSKGVITARKRVPYPEASADEW